MERPSSKGVLGVDGQYRSDERERKLNLMAVEVLGDAAGQDFLRYLESITIRSVTGPDISDAELRHREGARWLVGVISQRIDRGHKEKANGGSTSTASSIRKPGTRTGKQARTGST